MMTDEMTTLRESWSEVEPPSPGAQNRARAALIAKIAETRTTQAAVPAATQKAKTRRWRMPIWAWRSGIAAVGFIALVAVVVAAGGYGQSPD